MLKIGNPPNIMKNKAQEQNHKILSEDCILKHKVSSRIGQWLWEVAWNSSVFASFSSFSNSEQTKKNFLFIHTWQKQTQAKQTKQENSFESLLYERTKNQNRLPYSPKASYSIIHPTVQYKILTVLPEKIKLLCSNK